MPFQRQRPDLILTDEQRSTLTTVSRSRTDQQRRVERARILLAYAEGESISALAQRLGTAQGRAPRRQSSPTGAFGGP